MITRLDDGKDAAAVLAALEADGAVLIDHFVSTDVTDAINAEISSHRARPHDAWMQYEVAYAVQRYIDLIETLTDA